MSRYEKAARLFHATGGSWFVRRNRAYFYLGVDLTTRDRGVVQDLERFIPECYIVERHRNYVSWRLTKQPVTRAFLKALLPMLDGPEQVVLAGAIGRTAPLPPDAPYGALLRRLRQRAQLTQVQLAERLDCLTMTVASHEQGKHVPSERLARQLEEVLEAPGLGGFLAFWRKHVKR